MLRLFSYAVGILLLASAHQVLAQAQVTVPPAEKQQPSAVAPAHVDAATDTDEAVDMDGSNNLWMQKQADALLEVVGCYLGKKSLDNEVAHETKIDRDPSRLIEVRIRLLKTLANHNTPSHCK